MKLTAVAIIAPITIHKILINHSLKAVLTFNSSVENINHIYNGALSAVEAVHKIVLMSVKEN